MEALTNYFDLKTVLGILTYSLLIVFLCWVVSRIVRLILVFFLRKRFTSSKFGITSLKFTRNSLRFVFAIIAIFIIVFTIPVFRQKAGYIFSGAGLLAAIVGFAAQNAISNLIGGLFIVLFRPFRIGDYIRLDGQRDGIVEDITLRHTVINNFENKRLIIPNSLISTESILNHTIDEAKVLSYNNFAIGVHADIDLAKRIIAEEADKLEFVILNQTLDEVLKNDLGFDIRVVDITETAVTLRAYIWLSEPLWEYKMKCNLKEAVHKRFIKEGIELPVQVRRVIQ
ncbi:MAG: mechanosensitive ion channel family protein [Flavobacteriaceae bacterium]|nr:mechanosensitive ion channel family protein [Flavobacteriaceae bacterium]